MAANMTKEQERAELHRAIWQIANNLRGSVDGWDFKQYVLGMLFYRFISENLTKYINDNEPDKNFDYSELSNEDAEFGRADTVKEKGFYILPKELFVNVTKNARNDANLNETLEAVFKNIESSAKGTESEDDLKGLFDDLDVNSNKLGNTVELRNKKDLIEQFIASLDIKAVVDDDWIKFVEKKKIEELERIIDDENLNRDEAYRFIKNAFRDGVVPTTGTAITKVLPPVSRFSKTGERTKKRESILEKFAIFFERYFDISNKNL